MRSTVRNTRLIQCEESGGWLDAAIVEDSLVDGLKTHGVLQTWGAVFKHVTLRGKIGRVMISDRIASAKAPPNVQRVFDETNADYYSKIDWALDISEGEFEELDIRGVPALLIRRDPATQAIVTHEKALLGQWQKLDLSGTYWPEAIEQLVKRGDPAKVLVAARRARDFEALVDGLRKLRDAGVAEPD